MALEDDFPTLTAMLDRHLRPLGDGDAAAVDAFLAAASDAEREAVVAELREFCATQHDPDELRAYLMIHRFEATTDGGPTAWFAALLELLEHSFY